MDLRGNAVKVSPASGCDSPSTVCNVSLNPAVATGMEGIPFGIKFDHL